MSTKVVFIRSRRWAFGRDGHPALSYKPSCWIRANKFGKATTQEKWVLIEHHSENGKTLISLQSQNGRYLSSRSDGSIRTEAKISDNERWEVKATSKGFVSLKSHFGKFLCCDNLCDVGKYVRADRHEVKEWEEWMIVDDPRALTNKGSTVRAAIAGTLITVGSVATLGALAIPLAGFGVAGVAAGSTAAAVQSAVYGGATCGLFSVLQSVGATLAWVPVAGAGATATATGCAIAKKK